MMDQSGEPVLLDVSRLVWRAWRGTLPTGIDRTCMAYVAHYRARARAVVQRGGWVRVLSPGLSKRLFDLLLAPPPDARARLRSLLVQAIPSLGRAATLKGLIYLNVGHTGLDRQEHVDWLRASGVRPFYFVHDLIPLTHPEYCRPAEPEKHLRRMRTLLDHGEAVIANSRETLSELGIFAGLQSALTVPPGLVAPLGVPDGDVIMTAGSSASGASGAGAPGDGRPYFVMLGTIEGRKNHLLMLNIWAELARRLGSKCPQLVIIGQRGWESEQAVDMLDRCEALQGHVLELSRCDDARLAAYMAGAQALLFPSFVEGYGLPLVEALSHGTPVIASDLAVFRELAGDIPDYLSAIDGLGWRDLIEDYAAPASASRAEQLARMAGWKAPSWAAHFALVDRWIDRLS